jgi:phenylalanyl-tRNA synthetase beta chain
MQYSYNWLKELTKTKKSPQKLAEMVMLKGFEFEGKEELREKFENIIVGEIKEIKKHPDANKLQLVQVDVGEKYGGILKIVCGAHNIEIGNKVPVALIGAIIPQNKFKIEKAKIRGEVSHGMICAEDELGIGKDHGGILILDKEAKIGQPVAETLNLEDTSLEFDVLPDRAHDCLSYQGMAREICAMEGRKMKISNFKFQISNEFKNVKSLNIQIEERELCPRYIGAVMSGIKIKPSPKWMQARLVASGMEPINNIVDITNYVMLEIGSPLHAFDFKNILDSSESEDANIIIRKAKKDEVLELLDETKLKLTEKDLVIATKDKAIALAGIKGGKYSGIGDKTTKVILEAANFDQFNIRKTRQRHGLLTEAQLRFEKGISPRLAQNAVLRTIELFKKYAGAELVDYVDEDFSDKKKETIILDFNSVDSLLGFETDRKKNVEILENLGFGIIKKTDDSIQASIPYWRLDIGNQEDLIEEIGRIVGYEKIKEEAIPTGVAMPKINQKRKLEWKTKNMLAGLGFDEMINYSFYSKKDAKNIGIKGDHYEVSKPFSEEAEILRKTLLVRLLENTSLSSSYFDEFGIFELGKIYKVREHPEEELKIAGVIFSKEKKSDENFYVLKNKLESFLEKITKKEISFGKLEENIKIFDENEMAEIFIGKDRIGLIGNINKGILNCYKIKGNLAGFEIDFEKVFKLSHSNVEFEKLSKYPDARRDISMFVGMEIEAEKIIDIFKKQGGKYFKDAQLFDVFNDKKNNRKSLAFHLEFGAENRTLKNEEVDLDMANIIKNLEKEGIDVRKE